MVRQQQFNAIIARVNETFAIEIRPAEADMLTTVDSLRELIHGKLTTTGQARKWPDLQVRIRLQKIVADALDLWEEDVEMHHRFHVELACRDDPWDGE
jgi:acyl carrier protein